MNTRTFALIFGIIFLVVGIAGFIPGLVTYTAPVYRRGARATRTRRRRPR